MPKNPYLYQTIRHFLETPFGKYNSNIYQKYRAEYAKAKGSNQIKIVGYTQMGTSYLYHIQVKSESKSTKKNKYWYDVIIQFFPPNRDVENDLTLNRYYVRFFSNSPGFIYKYAALYKMHGFLIEGLYNKLDPDYIDTLPNKTNAAMDMYYDKSLYFACQYLCDHSMRALSKVMTVAFHKKISPDEFFNNIPDFRTIKIDQTILDTEKSIDKTIGSMINSDKTKPKAKKERVVKRSGNNKTKAGMTIVKPKAKTAKKRAKKSTFNKK